MPPLSKLEYQVPEKLVRFVGPQVEPAAKMMAARGMLPIPPADLVQVLFTLSREQDAELAKTAAASLAKMPENILKTVCEDQKSHPLILDFLARKLPVDSKLQDTIALNRSAHDETIIRQAGYPNKSLVAIISENQIRILRCPDIVDSLAENILTGQAQLDRIIKFVEMETKRSARAATPSGQQETPPPPEPRALVSEPKPEGETGEEEDDFVPAVTTESEDDIGPVTMEDGGPSPWARMTFDSDLLKEGEIIEDLDDDLEAVEGNLYQKIQKMKISQKIKLAMTGGSSARALLIRDSNKMVSVAVMKSPRITEKEIETISKSRAVCDDVIRMVSNSREWTRSYQIKMNLVQNPKTPTPDAMRFLNFLRDKDLRDLSKSRNVPNNISTQAKRLLTRREMKAKGGGKAH